MASAQVSRAAIEAEAEEAEMAEMAELNELAEAGVGEGDLPEGEGGSDEGGDEG